LQPGTWQLGLATALVGAGFGVGILILMRSIFRLTLNRPVMRMEEVYLLLMIGAFLGWQAVLCVVVLTVPLALIYAPVLYFGSRKCPFPFAPFLAIGAVLTLLLPWWFDQPLLNRLKAFLALE
jgi:leader peptidase (prepilin peptidase)/N-methyltransferase